jgi:thymidylate kinase
VLEGPDGAGKTTLAGHIASALEGRGSEVTLLSFPGKEPGTVGELVYRLHHDSRSLGVDSVGPAAMQTLHIAAHLDAVQHRILPSLSRGMTVILDRFWWSTVAYGRAAGVDAGLLARMVDLELAAWGPVRPAAAFLITRHAPLKAELNADGWARLAAIYERIAAEEGRSYPVHHIDNAGTVDQAVVAILKHMDVVPALRNGGDRCSQAPSSDAEHSPKPSQQTLFADDAQSRPAADVAPTTQRKPMRGNLWAPAEPTAVLDTYWRFAAERQAVFFRKAMGQMPPWTDDPILREYKFTNAYRASDRVSQFLIRHVIYEGSQEHEEVFFRIILFKLFNRIDTWELLSEEVGPVRWRDYSFAAYERVLSHAMARGDRVYSAAYMMPSGREAFGSPRKHANHLRLIESMMREKLPARISAAKSMQEAFELMRSYPTIGDFLAYQFVTDLNYSTLTAFTEMEFVTPGPGARDGIRKCFRDLGGLNEAEIISLVAQRQNEAFEQRGIVFQSLWGRPLQLIDCQNLFCEVDKYARVAHPEVRGISDRTRIKQKYRPHGEPIDYWFPPKWKLDDTLAQWKRDVRQP